MKIVVIIPSLNEEDSISKIVQVIDQGLLKYYPNSDSLILNVDSNSQDKTVETFTNTSTYFPKRSIVNKSIPKGKGSNILKAISRFQNADYFLTLDADLVSAKDIWINKLLTPLIEKKVGLVTPIYTRNRYEGNTTNHFSSPVIYTCLNKDVTQPIAGDFGFTKKLAFDIPKNIVTTSDHMYGIDTVITWKAILKEYKITQVKLGRKIHKPSFPKIVPMFEQVAMTTFRLANQNRHKIVENLNIEAKDPERHDVIDDKFVQAPHRNKIQEIQQIAIRRLDKYKPPDFVNKGLYKNVQIFTEEWTEILSEYLCFLIKNKLNAIQIESLARSIVGLYLFRVLGYFDEISNITTEKTGNILFNQKLLLRKRLITNFRKNTFKN